MSAQNKRLVSHWSSPLWASEAAAISCLILVHFHSKGAEPFLFRREGLSMFFSGKACWDIWIWKGCKVKDAIWTPETSKSDKLQGDPSVETDRNPNFDYRQMPNILLSPKYSANWALFGCLNSSKWLIKWFNNLHYNHYNRLLRIKRFPPPFKMADFSAKVNFRD